MSSYNNKWGILNNLAEYKGSTLFHNIIELEDKDGSINIIYFYELDDKIQSSGKYLIKVIG